MSSSPSRRRTLQERIEAIFRFIQDQEDVFPKSRLKEIGLNPQTSEKWLKLIEYIQSQPKIRLISSGHNTLIEKVEGNYQALMRKMVADESVPFENRLQYNTDYIKSLYTRERLKTKPIKQPFSRIMSIESVVHTFRILVKIDEYFTNYLQLFSDISLMTDEKTQYQEFNAIKKQIMLDYEAKFRIKTLLTTPTLRSQIQTIGENQPVLRTNFDQWKKTLLAVLRLR